jgi:hypothetical protein
MSISWLEIALWLSFFSQSAIFDTKTAFFEKGYDQKVFGKPYWDSAYVSHAKTTFGMFGTICFAVDSLTHTLCLRSDLNIATSVERHKRPKSHRCTIINKRNMHSTYSILVILLL